MRNIILASTASGKTYAAEKWPAYFIDGDTIINDTIGWPPDPYWWADRDQHYVRAVHTANAAAILNAARRLRDGRCVLWYSRMLPWEQVMAYMVPSFQTLRSNIAERIRSQTVGHPVSLELAKADRDWLVDNAWKDVISFNSWEQLVAFIHHARSEGREVRT